jgi:gliding motility-associated-like protein
LDVEITEPPLLTLDILATTDLLCNGDSDGSIEVLGAGGTPGYTYAIDGGAYGAGTVFTGLTAGTYTISVLDDNACETTLDVGIVEPTVIDVIETAEAESCAGLCDGSIDLSASGGTGAFLYSIDDCASTQPDGLFTDLCPGDYDICITDENGCQYNSIVTVEAGETTGDPTITPFGPLCENDAPVMIDAVMIGTLTGTGVAGGSFNPAVAGPGIHTVTNTLTDGCGAVATYNVTVYPAPNVSFMADVTNGCEALRVNFENTGDAGTSCSWYFGDGSFASSCGAATHTYEFDGTYDVTLEITDANGCSASASYDEYINVYPLPTANFSMDNNPATTNNPVVEFTDLSNGASSWEWHFEEAGSSMSQNPSITFPDVAGSYNIMQIAISDQGCRDTVEKVLNINQEQLIFVPNAITPDGDTYNEVFKPYMTGIDIYDYHLTIFNRWGEIVFESYDLSKGWNGTYGGEIVQDGVYIWQIITSDIATDKKLEFNGHVTVIK